MIHIKDKMIDGLTYKEKFIHNSGELLVFLNGLEWDDSMKARKTMSYGEPYNYSQIEYPFIEFPEKISGINDLLENELGYRPNNCLLNYYLDGNSSMGWHSDRTDILEPDTGVSIISIGSIRTLKFREIGNNKNIIDFELADSSLIHMTDLVQKNWLHSVPRASEKDISSRISLTFRKLKKI